MPVFAGFGMICFILYLEIISDAETEINRRAHRVFGQQYIVQQIDIVTPNPVSVVVACTDITIADTDPASGELIAIDYGAAVDPLLQVNAVLQMEEEVADNFVPSESPYPVIDEVGAPDEWAQVFSVMAIQYRNAGPHRKIVGELVANQRGYANLEEAGKTAAAES